MTTLKYSAATLALLLASSMAHAQNSTTVEPQAPAANKIECPAPGTMAEADLPADCKKDSILSNDSSTGMPKQDDSAAGSDPNATGTTTTTEVPKTDNKASADSTTKAGDVTTGVAAAMIDPAKAVLASQFMGQTVYSAGNDNVGEINDLVMNKDLDSNILAVIGVGGFLGIGEKDVAIPIDQISVSKGANGYIHLNIAATKEQLEAAPAFDRMALK